MIASNDNQATAEQRIWVDNGRGQRLAGALTGPVGASLAICCHGMLSSKDGDKHRLLVQLLQQRGVSAFRFDFAGLGESDGRLFDMTYSGEMHDLLAVIEHFAAAGVQRFGVFGSSMGGAVALLAAAREERVVALATLAAVAHPEALHERHLDAVMAWNRDGYVDTEIGRIGRQFMDDALEHDVLAAVRVLRAPLLVYHGEEDDVVPCSDGHDIAANARNAQLELVPGAGHRFADPVYQRPAMTHIADFLAAAIAQPSIA